ALPRRVHRGVRAGGRGGAVAARRAGGAAVRAAGAGGGQGGRHFAGRGRRGRRSPRRPPENGPVGEGAVRGASPMPGHGGPWGAGRGVCVGGAVAVVMGAPALAAVKWEYGELQYSYLPRRVIKGAAPLPAKTTVRWVTAKATVEADGWEDMAKKLKAPAAE